MVGYANVWKKLEVTLKPSLEALGSPLHDPKPEADVEETRLT